MVIVDVGVGADGPYGNCGLGSEVRGHARQREPLVYADTFMFPIAGCAAAYSGDEKVVMSSDACPR